MGTFERSLRRQRARQQARAPMVVAYDPSRFTDPLEAALIATRTAGCTCSPEIEVNGIHATVRHDAWCSVLRRQDVN
jgi:hypothetical protein